MTIYKTIPALLLCWFSLFSCRTPQIVTLTELRDSTIIREIPRIIEVPGTRIEQRINIDSIRDLLRQGLPIDVINRTLVRYDTSGKAQMRLLLDEMGGMTAICETQHEYINYLEKEIMKTSHQKEQITKTILKKQTPFWAWLIIGGLGTLTVLLSVILSVSRLKLI